MVCVQPDLFVSGAVCHRGIRQAQLGNVRLVGRRGLACRSENLPPGLQIITWVGWGLSSQGRDVPHVWNPGASESWDSVANASYAKARVGVSQELKNDCDASFGCTATYLRYSGVGTNGAFRSLVGGDVGSPGYTANPLPRFLGLTRDKTNVTLRFRVVETKDYGLQYKKTLRDTNWSSLIEFTAPSSILTVSDLWQGPPPPPRTRFYRLKEL